jgi:hypothetical protein
LRERLQDWGVVMLLCDYAEELGGKLYIMGGGWSQLHTAGEPSNIALAIRLSVPWTQANEPHDLAIRLLTEDGEPVPNDLGGYIELTGKVEVGRPAGLRPGTNLDLALAARFQGIELEAGGYRFSLEIDETELGNAIFNVMPVQQRR